MLRIDKDPSLKTSLIQEALKARGLYAGEVDNWPGKGTADALAAYVAQVNAAPATGRMIGARGLSLVKAFEGLFLSAYDDGGGVMTIGWGHTGLTHEDGTVYRGRTITVAEAEALLRYDMRAAEKDVNRLVKVPLSDDEFDALVSFQFNVGALASSTLLKKLNADDRAAAADQFLKWVYDKEASPDPIRGLVRRRKSERNLFLGKTPFIVPA